MTEATAGRQERFPYSRETWSLDGLFSISWATFKREWVVLCVATLIAGGIVMSIHLAGRLAAWLLETVLHTTAASMAMDTTTGIFQAVIQAVLQVGIFRMCVDALHGRKIEVGMLFGQVHKSGKVVLQIILATIVIAIPLCIYGGLVAGIIAFAGIDQPLLIGAVIAAAVMVAIVPVTYAVLPLYFMQIELANNDDVGAIQAIRNCFLIAKGKRLPMLGMFLLTSIIMASGLLLCCVGAVATVPFAQLLVIGTYLALRDGSGLPPVARNNQPPTTPGSLYPEASSADIHL